MFDLPAHDYLAIAMFASFIGLLFLGFPVAWILAGISILFTALGIVLQADFGYRTGVDWAYASLIVERTWDLMKNWVLVALPMFIFMGIMLDRSGVAERMMLSFSRLFGRVRGGIAIAISLIGILLAASTGIVGASVTLLALLGLPVMLNRRYAPELATGTIAAVGTLGILIPPSVMLVVMGDRLAVPVGDLFLGALIPGLLLGVLYMVYILIVANLKPEMAPVPDDAKPVDLAALADFAWSALPALALIIAVLGTIFFGIATPTEASGIGALGAMLLAAVNRKLDIAGIREAGRQTTQTTAYIFAIMVGATGFALVFRGLGGDELIEAMLNGLGLGPHGLLWAVLFLIFILGFFLDWIEITLVVLPLITPVMKSVGFDPVWFLVLVAVVLQSSFLTPPVGYSLFYLKGVAPPGVTTLQIYRGIIPFCILILICTLLTYLFPALVTWLPAVSYG